MERSMFEQVWKKYPADSRLKGSKAEGEKVWNKLSASDQLEVWQSLDGYADHLACNPWKQPMMFRTYCRKDTRRWEPYLPEPDKPDAETEKRRAEVRRLRRWQAEQAEEQWRKRFEQTYGRRPA